MKRRQFIRRAVTAAAVSSAVGAGIRGWTWQNPVLAQASGSTVGAVNGALPTATPRLIVLLLRGAVDGLNVVVPYQEQNYYASRPTIAIAQPGEEKGAIDLDGQFGMHPALKPLASEWESGNLAFIHAVGSPVVERSHFQAQDYIETGMLEATNTTDGWLNRLVGVLPSGATTQAVNIGRTAPLIFAGTSPVASLAVAGNVSRPFPTDRSQIKAAFDRLYAGDDTLARTYQEGRKARDVLLQEFSEENMAASRGAPAPGQFLTSAEYVARLMVGDAATQVAFMDLGNWDTHINERATLERHLSSLGDGLAALATGLGDAYDHTSIVIMSEFGRTVAENGNGGTDHGFGNIIGLLGGGIKGGKFYGEWPGLELTELHQNRDLKVTTDFRDVLISLLSQQFQLSDSQIEKVFPGYRLQKNFDFM